MPIVFALHIAQIKDLQLWLFSNINSDNNVIIIIDIGALHIYI